MQAQARTEQEQVRQLNVKVRIKDSVDCKIALVKASVPRFVATAIIGREVNSDGHGNVEVDWNGTKTLWNIPSECFETSFRS